MTAIHEPAVRTQPRLVTPVTVLLIEDSEVDAALVSEMLSQARGLNAKVVRRDRLESGLMQLGKGGVDIVLPVERSGGRTVRRAAASAFRMIRLTGTPLARPPDRPTA